MPLRSQFAAPSLPVVSGADAWGWKEYVQMCHLFCVYRCFGEFCSQLGGHHAGDWEEGRSVSFTPPNVGAKKRRKEEVVDWVSVGDECILAGKRFHLHVL